jgi:hypothetical protein
VDAVRHRFPIRFGRVFGVLSRPLGMGPRRSYVDVGDDAVGVRMGWAFRADVPRSSVVETRPLPYVWWAIGVHGWKGRWIVNGSGHGMVALRLEPPARARVLGAPVSLRELSVSVDDPAELRAALAPGAENGGRPSPATP